MNQAPKRSSSRRLVSRALILVLGGVAWWAWHPNLLATVTAAPTMTVYQTHALSAGVTLRLALVPPRGWRIIDFVVDLAHAHLEVGTAPGGGWLEDLIPEGTIAAVNGAFFEQDLSPHGWLVAGGHELHPRTAASPHHVFAVKGLEVFGGHWEALGFVPDFAMQNFPLLVENGVARVQQTDRDPGFARTFICDSGKGTIHLVVVLPTTDRGPTLFETARIATIPSALGGFGCLSAVNLDGGPSSGFWVNATTGIPFVAPPVRIGHSLAIVPH